MSETTDLPAGSLLGEYANTTTRLLEELHRLSAPVDERPTPPTVEEIFGIPFKASGITDDGQKIMTSQDIAQATGLSLDEVAGKIADAERAYGQPLIVTFGNLNPMH